MDLGRTAPGHQEAQLGVRLELQLAGAGLPRQARRRQRRAGSSPSRPRGDESRGETRVRDAGHERARLVQRLDAFAVVQERRRARLGEESRGHPRDARESSGRGVRVGARVEEVIEKQALFRDERGGGGGTLGEDALGRHRGGFERVRRGSIAHAGEEIVEQLYRFELHGRRLALRPEMTPSIARMVMARAGALRLPLRWFAVTQNWRYERMTRGRRREHYQWNMDVWGEPGVTAEAELIAAAFALMDAVGLAPGDVRMRVNSRALLEEVLEPGDVRR